MQKHLSVSLIESIRMYRKYIKRGGDFIFSLFLIILLIPVFIIIAVLVAILEGRPILFSQKRIGKHEKEFTLFKFRSMSNAIDEKGVLLSETQRLTKFGVFLRSSSLDELPELFSILKGDMSFVGPRPLPSFYLPYLFDNERKRHQVRGGLIPPDSLSGKAYTTWEEQFKYEMDYVSNVTFKNDSKIIWMTIKILFLRYKSNYGNEFRPHLDEYRRIK